MLGGSYSQSLAGGVTPNEPCVAGTTLGLVNRAPLGAIIVDRPVIFGQGIDVQSGAQGAS